jgi:alpha/gamma adaptin binding protein p34
MGVERLREALEANDWDGNDGSEGDINFDDLEAGGGDDEDAGSIGFGIDPAEMKEEMVGMKQAIYEGSTVMDDEIENEEEGDEEIQALQAMMLKMQAVRGKFLGV